MFTMRYPVSKRFMYLGVRCMINQLFGDSKNRLFYGPEGHTGIDFKTTGDWKYRRDNMSKTGWTPITRTPFEEQGRVPLFACHDGEVQTVLYDNKQGLGWGLYVTADPTTENGQEVQYRTLYWHIETPWASLDFFKGTIKTIAELVKIFNKRRVLAGAIVAIGGNNGMSTGPHLHLALDRRKKVNGVWSSWQRINPMPYFRDNDVVAHCTYLYDTSIVDMKKANNKGMYTLTYWYNGEQITQTQSQAKEKSILKPRV